MAWTDERIAQLKHYWEQGLSASQIAETLGEGLSRNAVIGKAHRLGLSSRPSPLKSADKTAGKTSAAAPARAAKTPRPARKDSAATDADAGSAKDGGAVAEPAAAAPPPAAPVAVKVATEKSAPPSAKAAVSTARPTPRPAQQDPTEKVAAAAAPAPAPQPAPEPAKPEPVARPATSSPVDSQPPRPREPEPLPELVLAASRPRPKGERVSLLDLNERICKWPIGHPDEADFHFCGRPVNPGFPYCGDHCLVAYQAQMPRRDRPGGAPHRPFGPNLPRPR